MGWKLKFDLLILDGLGVERIDVHLNRVSYSANWPSAQHNTKNSASYLLIC